MRQIEIRFVLIGVALAGAALAHAQQPAPLPAFEVASIKPNISGPGKMQTTTRPGGVFVILETSIPEKVPFRQGYQVYTKMILPLIGKLFSKDRVAYGYLCESASVFPYGEKLNNILRKIGFINVVSMPQTFGVATIYSASKNT